MKYFKILFGTLILLLIVSCDKWTMTETYSPTDLEHSVRTETYYANLRAYKQRSHPIVYGKWHGWTGTGATMKGQLIGLPDSLDIVGIMKDTLSFTVPMLSDLQMIQTQKGTKIVLSVSIKNVGDGLPTDAVTANVEQYAMALIDIVNKNGFDGLDIELRPQTHGIGTLAGNVETEKLFVQTLSRYVGPKSGTGKLLILSGEPEAMNMDEINSFNYLVSYVFGVKSDTELDKKLTLLAETFSSVYSHEGIVAKVIFMEDFLNNTNGGVPYTDRYNNNMFSLEGIARWLPILNGHHINKAGIGVYRMDQEYTMDGFNNTFPYLHQAIQIVNPSIK